MRTKERRFEKRKERIRTKISKVARERCRLCVSKSNFNISAQIIDDSQGKVLASASTLEKEVRSSFGAGNRCNLKTAAYIGDMIAKRAMSAGVKTVVFDRGGYIYHGCVKAFADAARSAGLAF